ncbi:MAG TPA: gamma-glutamyl-gamma-aminobutyrate hydrolase family protein [Terriglobales bacterium]|nr:gamma-glutamyl-gamma-aminobutyrate hydrolase family protein [Terriglobales bacterium]
MTRPRIAIPVPHSGDPDYAGRALPQYEKAVEMAGGEPVRIPLDQPASSVINLAESCDALLLPGSRADVQPSKYGASRDPQTADADLPRDAVDDLLLRDAYERAKPVLGICYGLQSLNVYRKGSLVQHIESAVNHEAGRKVAIAHEVAVEKSSMLERIVSEGGAGADRVAVNSSHHQSAEKIGEGLRVSARCPDDGIIEALEGTAPGHFVLAVQWHPERSVDDDGPSRRIFHALVEAAKAWREHLAARSSKS